MTNQVPHMGRLVGHFGEGLVKIWCALCCTILGNMSDLSAIMDIL